MSPSLPRRGRRLRPRPLRLRSPLRLRPILLRPPCAAVALAAEPVATAAGRERGRHGRGRG
eukprot:8166635-Alexandrium_andersonii.AAC.1